MCMSEIVKAESIGEWLIPHCATLSGVLRVLLALHDRKECEERFHDGTERRVDVDS